LKIVFLLLILLLFLLKIFILFYFNFIFDNLFKGLLNNLITYHSSIFFDSANLEGQNGHTIVNCSFENIKSTDEWPGAISIYDANAKYNITDCFFRNISNNFSSSVKAGAINCEMNNTNNYGYHNISRNTFIEIKTNKSVITLIGNFSSLIFSYNSFYNVSSSG
jgi:hypothetical protein